MDSPSSRKESEPVRHDNGDDDLCENTASKIMEFAFGETLMSQQILQPENYCLTFVMPQITAQVLLFWPLKPKTFL